MAEPPAVKGEEVALAEGVEGAKGASAPRYHSRRPLSPSSGENVPTDEAGSGAAIC